MTLRLGSSTCRQISTDPSWLPSSITKISWVRPDRSARIAANTSGSHRAPLSTGTTTETAASASEDFPIQGIDLFRHHRPAASFTDLDRA